MDFIPVAQTYDIQSTARSFVEKKSIYGFV